MSVELLSPAGDFDTAIAAFEYGADAVYCGLSDFSARAFAKNLSREEKELINKLNESPNFNPKPDKKEKNFFARLRQFLEN